MTSQDKIRQILWTDYFSCNTTAQCASTQAVLNNDIYSTIRSVVIQTLGTVAASSVADLDIGL